MAPKAEITIPNTTISDTTKPYTIYNISVRLPLRSFTIQKRYSDFLTFHDDLTRQVGSAPPASLPGKAYFTRTVANPVLTEARRKELEQYLKSINNVSDSRWRSTNAWSTFLSLPSTVGSQSSTASNLRSVLASPAGAGAAINDPVIWLDQHRDLKSQLHFARLSLTNRDQASTPQQQHEASVAAKGSLVKAGGMISALEEGLQNIQKNTETGWGAQKLGEGEIRRRKDLIAFAKKDKEGLENLLEAMTAKSKLDHTVASIKDSDALFESKPKTGGRVLGKETTETRQLDNKGVLQLQVQKMADQDQDVEELTRIIRRQKQLGIEINQELEIQNEMLKMVDEDVDRVQAKLDIAKKRIGKIH